MKKYIKILLCISMLIVCMQSVNAVLTNQAPTKSQSATTKTTKVKPVTQSAKTNYTNTNYNNNNDFADYKKKVAEAIESNAKCSQWYSAPHLNDLTAVVEFGISEDGNVNYASLVKSSGAGWYDSFALRSVQVDIHLQSTISRMKYDPLPKSFNGTCSNNGNTYQGKCMVLTHTFTSKASMKKESDKVDEDHIKDI